MPRNAGIALLLAAAASFAGCGRDATRAPAGERRALAGHHLPRAPS
ncbi:MAG: hypothetical protein HYY06_11345 [Deltaproteobacteria bacterium]|nr:hypothetical protein [Deltaproteobacteria bacterium]